MTEWIVREADYYGGDIVVSVEETSRWEDGAITIRWQAWGRYGTVSIRVTHEEARTLSRALATAGAEVESAIERVASDPP